MLSLVEANLDDCELFFNLANDDEVRNNSFNSEKISFDEHKRWFENIYNDKKRTLYKILKDKNFIGQIRLDSFDKNSYLISISLDKEFRSKGFAFIALEQIIRDKKTCNFKAQIKKENLASISLFKRLGFKYIGGVDYIKKGENE